MQVHKHRGTRGVMGPLGDGIGVEGRGRPGECRPQGRRQVNSPASIVVGNFHRGGRQPCATGLIASQLAIGRTLFRRDILRPRITLMVARVIVPPMRVPVMMGTSLRMPVSMRMMHATPGNHMPGQRDARQQGHSRFQAETPGSTLFYCPALKGTGQGEVDRRLETPPTNYASGVAFSASAASRKPLASASKRRN